MVEECGNSFLSFTWKMSRVKRWNSILRRATYIKEFCYNYFHFNSGSVSWEFFFFFHYHASVNFNKAIKIFFLFFVLVDKTIWHFFVTTYGYCLSIDYYCHCKNSKKQPGMVPWSWSTVCFSVTLNLNTSSSSIRQLLIDPRFTQPTMSIIT